ncbi:Deuterolysin metalloprotease family-domain-containing protein [Aspergillus alliaceus]|uniref:Deuterolysin metalloprotease family-domain-containing protein n=1 Tax=Petromyces alliaceus TaxID=209559 RepID=UPI0012A53520|nr:Deuterolysin metalloprotease family-domain-containing protein [Aspergillus alliaceus]KAB8237546.1 Deuterolysin metalloprotease family-domain-containing protein [Aspergillus alliaceus]
MSFFQLVQFFGLLTLAAGKPVHLPRQASGAPQDGAQNLIDVQLEALGNSTVKALIKNVADESLRVVKRGGLLDKDLPTKKVVVSGSENPTFSGARVDYINSHLTPEAFMDLAPNQTVESIFDIADSHDLAAGKKYSAIADGMLEYTKADDHKKFFVVPYKSNSIDFEAPENVESRLTARATMSGCDGQYDQLMKDNLKRVSEMATAAAKDARDGSSGLLKKFFKSDSEADKKEVSGRLEAIAKEATSTGTLTYYCQAEAQDSCGGNIAAITYPTMNRVVNCQAYYQTQQVVNECGYLDQAAISLHEFAHATSVYSPGTEDVVYGLQGVLGLDNAQAKNNADSYAYYANGTGQGNEQGGNQGAGPTGTQIGGGSSSPFGQGTGQGNEMGGGSISPFGQGTGQGNEMGGGPNSPFGQGTQGNGQDFGQGTQGDMGPWEVIPAEEITPSGSGWPSGFGNQGWGNNQGSQPYGGPSSTDFQEVSSAPSGNSPYGEGSFGNPSGGSFGDGGSAPWSSQGFGEGSGWFKRDQ